jgi:hypothetical protein
MDALSIQGNVHGIIFRRIPPIPTLGSKFNGIASCHVLQLGFVGPDATFDAIGVLSSHRNGYHRNFIVKSDS